MCDTKLQNTLTENYQIEPHLHLFEDRETESCDLALSSNNGAMEKNKLGAYILKKTENKQSETFI